MTEDIISIIIFFLILYIWKLVGKVRLEKELEKEQERQDRFLRQTSTLQDAYDLTPEKFEELIMLLFEKLGYKTDMTSYTSDGGIDIFIYKDDRTELVQCKKYRGSISVKTVREFFGVMIDKRVSKGYIVTTGHFTLPARQFANGKGIHLIDGSELAQMLCDYGL